MNNYTDFLYARSSFTEGIARLLDFGNTLTEYNGSSSAFLDDMRALRADWMAKWFLLATRGGSYKSVVEKWPKM